MTSAGTLLIRADAGVRMGTGHIMRCLALAQAWQDTGGEAAFAVAACPAGVEERLAQEDIELIRLSPPAGSVEDAHATAEAAFARRARWVVADGYHFGGDYQKAVKQKGLNLLAVDDCGEVEHYWADVVLNQDLNAEESLYGKREPYTRLLLGPQYVSLRREFRRMPRPCRQSAGPGRKLLVTLGGSDPDNVSESIIRSLDKIRQDGLETIVLVGPGNPHGARLLSTAAACQTDICVLQNPPHIADLMAWCDAAITAGGSTLWELAYFAVPCLVLVIAANQEPCARRLHDQEACRVVGEASGLDCTSLAEEISKFLQDAPLRAALARKFATLVDGQGGQRVCDVLRADKAQFAT